MVREKEEVGCVLDRTTGLQRGATSHHIYLDCLMRVVKFRTKTLCYFQGEYFNNLGKAGIDFCYKCISVKGTQIFADETPG